MLSSINTAALARSSSSIENQLISLWSAVEVLLTEPPRSKPRILHYAKLLAPCVCLRHIRRQMTAVYEQMLVARGREFRRILRQAKEQDRRLNFGAVLFFPEHEHLREQLMALCRGSPLAQHRLWKLRRDYNSPGDVRRTIEDHQRRVEWQIHRIYRARNQLVHAGYIPSYLDSLVMNLAEYYRSTIFALVGRATRENAESDIDQVVAEIGIEYRILLDSFGKHRADKTLTRDDLSRLI
jgi:hypothetical protein